MHRLTGLDWKRICRAKPFVIAAIIIAVLLVIHASLPFVLLRYVNHTLAKVPGYRGHIGYLVVNLFRGAYQIRELKMEKASGDAPVPFFSAETMDLSIEWPQLIHGALVGAVIFDHPKLNFVAGVQENLNKEWMRAFKRLFPLKINTVEAKDGEIRFMKMQRGVPVEVFIQNVEVKGYNFTNSERLSTNMVATLKMTGFIPESGWVWVYASVDPMASKPSLKLQAEMRNVELAKWNKLIHAYAGVEVTEGRLDLFTEMAAADGVFRGYVKPMFYHLQVFNPANRQESWLEKFWSAIVGVAAEALKNQPRNQLATKVELRGDFQNPNTDTFSALVNLLRNAFVRALLPNLEGGVKVPKQT